MVQACGHTLSQPPGQHCELSGSPARDGTSGGKPGCCCLTGELLSISYGDPIVPCQRSLIVSKRMTPTKLNAAEAKRIHNLALLRLRLQLAAQTECGFTALRPVRVCAMEEVALIYGAVRPCRRPRCWTVTAQRKLRHTTWAGTWHTMTLTTPET